jgi:hypothetical protein
MKLDVKHLPSDYPKDVPAGWSPITNCNECGKPWLWGVTDNQDFTCPNCQVVDEDGEEDPSNADYIPGHDDGEAELSDEGSDFE